ncbi:MAG: HNH endonuclease [Chloroflexi bacterium]|nr:MAG: HNH endonuclease [Chloroflexota bacterium]
MIHQVSKLPHAKRMLQDILVLQVSVLEAAGQIGITENMVLDANVFTPVLQAHLESKRRFSGRSEAIARWIMTGKKGIRKSLVEPLNKFANGPQADKSQFISDIINDIFLLYRPKAAAFRVAVLENETLDWRKGARDFLYEFYDLWQSGFPACIFPAPSKKYTRQDFVQEFELLNPGLFICAVCDGSAYSTKTVKHIYTSVDHFFPRSIYPHLSCHPLNLIPICSSCNSYIKGDIDPLTSNGLHFQLVDFILPYQQLDLAFSKKSYIAVVKRDPRENKFLHPMKLELRPAREFEAGNKITAFNNLYKIDERWSESLHEIEDHVFRRITQYLSLIDPVNSISDSTTLIRYLKALMSQTDLENIGKDPYAFPMVWLFKSYIDQIEAQHENAPIFKALLNWAAQNRQRWEILEAHSLEIQRRVPDA